MSAGTAFDTLLDGEYRRMWDENVIEDYELCALDGTNDIGYYSCKHSFTVAGGLLLCTVCNMCRR